MNDEQKGLLEKLAKALDNTKDKQFDKDFWNKHDKILTKLLLQQRKDRESLQKEQEHIDSSHVK